MNKSARKALRNLKLQCAHVIQVIDSGEFDVSDTALHSLKAAIRDWGNSGEDALTALFSDEMSGELELSHLGKTKDAARYDANELYQLEDGTGGFVVMTGLEFESIVKQFLAFKK